MAGVSYRAWGLLLALGGVVGFGFRPVFVKLCYAVEPVSPVTLLFLRMLVSLPFFAAVAWWLAYKDAQSSTKRAPLTPREWAAVAGLAFVGYYLASFLDFIGLQYVGAGVGRLILFMYPTMVVALSLVFLKKRPSRRELAALVISYAGIALVVSGQIGAQGQDSRFLFGVLMCLSAALSYATYLVAGSELTRRIGSMRFTAYTMIVSTLPAAIQFFALEPLAAFDLSARLWWTLLGMVVFATVIPSFMVAEALKRVGANQFALIGAVGPVVTVYAGAIGLEEPVTAIQVAGSVLVISGVLLVSLKSKAS
ncbi:MAG: DMT family transporter [Burkholderiales bacterium]